MLTDPGLTPISLVSGLRKWWVTDIVLCSEMLRLGNLRVVSLEVEQIDVLVLSMTIPRVAIPGNRPRMLRQKCLALWEVALPLTVISLMPRPLYSVVIATVVPVVRLARGQTALAVISPLAVLIIVIPILACRFGLRFTAVCSLVGVVTSRLRRPWVKMPTVLLLVCLCMAFTSLALRRTSIPTC